MAKSPAAGTIIKNQASATYKDSAGVQQTATSNLVETVIQQVGGVELVQSQSRYGAAGQMVSFPHVLTNTGNGDDSYNLNAANATGDDFDFTNIQMYADQNQDGIADNLTPITTTGVLAAEEAFYFVIQATIAPSATDQQSASLDVTGVSTATPTSIVTDTKTDTAIVTDKAVIQVTKSMSTESGIAGGGGLYTVTLTYNNPSATTATAVTLIDKLPVGMSYVAGSGRWSVTGAGTVLTDASGDSQGTTQTVTYCANGSSGCTASANEINAVVASVAAGDSGTISFDVTLDALAVGGAASTLLNTGEFSYNNSAVSVAAQSTNQVPLLILTQPSVVANISTTDSTNNTDKVIVASVGRGGTAAFENVIWNMGNNTDTFDIVIDEVSDTFPTGTTFMLYHSDGHTPLLDTDNSGAVDTGPMEPGENFVVVLKAKLPMNATVGTNGGNGFEVTKTAISATDSTISDAVTDHLDEIIDSSVDLTNIAPLNGDGVKGVGIGPETNAQSRLIIAPGGSGTFILYANNTSTVADSFDLSYSSTYNSGNFAAGTAPAGWQVAFHADAGAKNCSTLGPVISNTATIQGGESKLICAKVTLPVDAAFSGGEVSIYFRVMSALTGAQDIKHDSVYMTADHQLVLEPDNRGQVEPGQSVVYSHHLNNPGNTTFTNITFDASNTLSGDGWSSALYWDSNGNGELDAADKMLPQGNAACSTVPADCTLASGESMLIFAKVFAPANAPYNSTNLTDITVIATTNAGSSVNVTLQAQDMTIVNKSNMKIVKMQAADKNCDGDVNTKTFGFEGIEAQPGTCVLYMLSVTNSSAEVAHNVRINDAIPEYTTHFTASNALPTITAGTIIQKPLEGGSGLVEGNAGIVNGGVTVTLIFGVKVE